MKIIVTGGAGFIGGNFIHHMVNKYPEYDIVNLDLLTYAGNLETLKPVALSRKVYDHIGLFLFKQIEYEFPVRNVALYKFIVGLSLHGL